MDTSLLMFLFHLYVGHVFTESHENSQDPLYWADFRLVTIRFHVRYLFTGWPEISVNVSVSRTRYVCRLVRGLCDFSVLCRGHVKWLVKSSVSCLRDMFTVWSV